MENRVFEIQNDNAKLNDENSKMLKEIELLTKTNNDQSFHIKTLQEQADSKNRLYEDS